MTAKAAAEDDAGGVALGALPSLVHVEQVAASKSYLAQLVQLVDITVQHSNYFVDVTYYFQLHHYEIS